MREERKEEEEREGKLREKCRCFTITFHPSVQPDTFICRAQAHGERSPASLHCCAGTDFVACS